MSDSKIREIDSSVRLGWASLLIQGFREGKLNGPLLWDLLFAYADQLHEPNVQALLANLIDPAESPPLPFRASGDEWIVVSDDIPLQEPPSSS